MAPGAFLTMLVLLFIASLLLKFPLVGFIIALVIWGFIGSIAGRIVRGTGFGLLGNILLGFLGGITGGIILGLLGLGFIWNIPFIGGIVSGVIGAVIFIFAMRLIDRNFAR